MPTQMLLDARRRLGRRPPHRGDDPRSAPRRSRRAATPRPPSRAQFTLPTARTFTLSGSASLSALIPDDEIDRLVGRTPTPSTGLARRLLVGAPPRRPAGHGVGHARRRPRDGLAARARAPTPRSGATLTYDLRQAAGAARARPAGDRRRPPLRAHRHDRHLGEPGAHRRAAAHRRRHGARRGDRRCRSPSRPLTGSHFVVTFTAVRPEYAANYYSAGPLALPLGIAEVGHPRRAGPRRRRPHLPGTCVSNLLSIDGQPIDVAVVGSAQHALDNGEAQLVPCGPDAKGITLGAGPHVVQTAVGHNPPCARPRPPAPAGTSTSWSWTRPPAAAPARPCSRPPPGRPGWPATQPGPRPDRHARPRRTSTATAPTVTGAHAALRARARPERQQGLAGGGRARPGRAGGLARGGPRGVRSWSTASPTGGTSRAADLHALGGPGFTRRADLDAPARGLGRARRLGGDAAALPRARLPARRGRGAGCAAQPAPPPARRRPGPSAPERPAIALRRRRPWPCPARRRPRTNANVAGCASRGRCSSAPSPGGVAALVAPPGAALVVARWWWSSASLVPWARAARHRGRRRVHRRRLRQRGAGAERAPLPARLQLGRLVRPRGQPDLVRRRAAARRRRDLGPRPARREAGRAGAPPGPQAASGAAPAVAGVAGGAGRVGRRPATAGREPLRTGASPPPPAPRGRAGPWRPR